MTRTTLYLDEGEYQKLKQLARQQRKPPAELVRAAISDYLQRHRRPSPLPKSLGVGDSGLSDLASRDEHYLKGFGES